MDIAKITIVEWANATIEQRALWLQSDVNLDGKSRRILDWALAFRRCGANISDGMLVKMYERECAYIGDSDNGKGK